MNNNIAWFLRAAAFAVKTFRLSLPKIGVGWMFALLTINFNRITIVELNIVAVVVTTMLAMHYFLSPFQVIVGRYADRHPVAGYRRTPYLLAAAIVGSLIFLTLPSIAFAMGQGVLLGYAAGFVFFLCFGITVAVLGDSHHSLIAESVGSRSRGGVISVVWTFTIISTIMAAGAIRSVMPEYTPEAMQRLYNLTPFIVIGSTLLGVLGMEKRLNRAEVDEAASKSQRSDAAGEPDQCSSSGLERKMPRHAAFSPLFLWRSWRSSCKTTSLSRLGVRSLVCRRRIRPCSSKCGVVVCC
ncbi:BCD family MFS transporter [bacterium]|nr:BCD family MFS transporter [bacterium]